jgi:LysM repeat protein
MERRQFIQKAGLLLGSMWTFDSIAAPTTYKVLRGDTLSGIANKFDTSVSNLKRINRLKSDRILAGQSLKIRETIKSALPAAAAQEINGVPIIKNKWVHIVVHHSATPQGGAKSFHNTHLRRGMQNGLAYHFVIGNGTQSGDGEIEVGPRWEKQQDGGHVANAWFNANSIGICLVGNFQKHWPSPKQMDSLHRLLSHLKSSDQIQANLRLFGHKEVKGAQTLCPGKNLNLNVLHKNFNLMAG